jgi:hypothetical protein
MNDVTAILLAARTLIADPRWFTQDVFATDANGTPVSLMDPRACCFCTEAAIRFVAHDSYGWHEDYGALRALERVIGYVPTWSDCHSHAEVIAAFDRAIVLSEEGAQ